MGYLKEIPPAPRDVPQIEVTFEVDENSILKVTAVCKETGKSNKITITNDKGRLSKEEIEKMVKDAENFAEQDKKTKAKIDSKQSLSNYLYSMKNTVETTMATKLSEADKSVIQNNLK